MAKLYFRYGAMNSGKTTALLQVAYNYEERGQKVIIVKPKVDAKGVDKIVSRIGLDRKVDFLIDVDDIITEKIKDFYNSISCILVDEAQFLTPQHVEQLYAIAKVYEIPVICYGLKVDFMSHSFPGSKRLFELADALEELVTVCRCGKKARLNSLKVDGNYLVQYSNHEEGCSVEKNGASNDSQIIIDNDESLEFEAVCGKCYFEKVLKRNKF